MPFGVIGRTDPGMRHVIEFGIGPREGVLLGASLGRAIVTNGDLLSLRRGPLPKLLWADLFYTVADIATSWKLEVSHALAVAK